MSKGVKIGPLYRCVLVGGGPLDGLEDFFTAERESATWDYVAAINGIVYRYGAVAHCTPKPGESVYLDYVGSEPCD